MKVKMKVGITGRRDGSVWPAIGGVIEVSASEGAELCALGYAEPVAEPAKREKATAPKPEKRAAKKSKS